MILSMTWTQKKLSTMKLINVSKVMKLDAKTNAFVVTIYSIRLDLTHIQKNVPQNVSNK